jgi:NAD(P)-dependent dehydrogenase (short-subunit alcohol dehydrogenase family)
MQELESQTGKVWVVAGATGGIGAEVCRGLAVAGATVVMLVRDEVRGRDLRADLVHDTGGHIDIVKCDYSDFDSVREAANALMRDYPRIQGFAECAGTLSKDRVVLDNGHEKQWAVNVLGPWLLLDRLKHHLLRSAPARVVVLAGRFHKNADLDLEDPDWANREWDFQGASDQSQLGRLLMTMALANETVGTGVTATCVHPGEILTETQDKLPWHLRLLVHTVLRPAFADPQTGAEAALHLAAGADVAGVTGKYFHQDHLEDPHPAALDPDIQAYFVRHAQQATAK